MTRKPPFRADHAGSLLRPDQVLAAWTERDQGKISGEDVRKIEDKAVQDLVKLQEEIGLSGITDGECRRKFFHTDFLEQVGGVTVNYEGTPKKFRAADGTEHTFSPPKMLVVDKLRHDKDIMLADFNCLKAATTKMPKMTIPSPTMVHFRGGRRAICEKAYPEMGEFFERSRLRSTARRSPSLADAGCRYLQFDDTNLAYLCDHEMRETAARNRRGSGRAAATSIPSWSTTRSRAGPTTWWSASICAAATSRAWASPRAATSRSPKSCSTRWTSTAIFLEYDDERSGDFAPLRFMPKGKTAVLGIVTSKVGALETKDALKRRIDEAAKYCPLDQLAISPQCGFASTHDGNMISVEQQKAKLRLCVEVADEVWGQAA